MAIEVDDTFLNRVRGITNQLSSDIVSSPQGTLSALVVKAGTERFPLGTTIVGQVAQVSTALSTLLTGLGTTAGTRAAQIALFLASTDDTESLNNQSAQDFLHTVPGWSQTGGTPPPAGNPPPTTPA